MKKISIRKLLFGLLIAASIASFIYINTVSIDVATTETSNTTEHIEEQEAKSDNSSMVLPDVELVKRFIEKTTRFVPST